jgi:hypothetical protein
MLPIALLWALLGSVSAVQAQTTLYTQNFSSFTAGTGVSGDNGVACSATGTGPAANGASTGMDGSVSWQITAPPAALPDECSFIKVVSPGGNNRLHTRNLRGEEGCFRLSGISISGYQAVVSLDLGIAEGVMEAGDGATIKIYVDGSATPALVQPYNISGNNSIFSVSYTSPSGSPFLGSTLDLEVCFRCGDAPPATTGALETWYLDNIAVTGIACATVVDISGQENPCFGSTHTYSIASPPANHTFVWSLPDGGGNLTPAMDGLSAEVAWNGAGPRTVRVTATDLATSCVSEHDYAITVRTGPTVAALSDLGPFCPGSNLPAISLSTSPVNSDVSFSWSGGGAIGIPDGSDDTAPFAIPAFTTQNASATVLSPTISVIATDEIYGCVGDPETFTVTVNSAPDLVLSGSSPAICLGDTYNLGDLIDNNLANSEVVDQNDVMNLGYLVYFQQPYEPANQQQNLMVSPMATTTYYFVKPTLGGCIDDLAVVLTVSATPVSNATTNTNYATLQAAIDAATAGDVITLNCDHTEGLVTINKPLTLQGGGKVLTSTSASWGISIAANGVVIEDITVEDAGTFGIITQCGFSNLTITNATVREGGGTGFAINGVNDVMLNNITALDNGGNGISISDCNNVTINGLTTSGNAFGGGFSAGVGIFSGGACSPPAGVTNVTITGEVNISEPTTVYEQILGGGGIITNTVVNPTSGTTPPQTHALGIANSRFFTPDLATAFAAAQTVINDPMTPTSNTLVYVEEISSRDHFLDIALAPDMIIQPAITYAYPDITVHIAEGTYAGNVNATGMGQAVILSPGSSPGIVTISGDLILDSDDELVMEIDGVTPGTEHDQFVVTGTVNLGGADLSLTVAALTAGQQITLIDGSSAIIGQFVQANTITIGMDTYSIIYNGGMDGFDVVLTVCGPSATVDNNGSLCPDATLELTTLVSGGFGPYTYSWSGPDGFTSMNANPTILNVSAANEGLYSVTVTDATLCSTVGTTTFSLFPVPTVSATTDLLTDGSVSVACTNEDFTITIDGTGNPVGTTYSANWSLSALFGSPDLMLVSGTGDFATKPTSPSTATTISGSFINPLPNENSIQIDLTITATTPDGCSESFDLVVYLRPEVTVSGIAPGLPATLCSGDNVPAQTITLLPSGGTRSINWAWSGVDITAMPANGTDAAAPFEVSLTNLVNSGGAIQTATLAVTPLLSYVTPVAQVCAGDVAPYTTQVDPGPAVMDQTDMACSGAALGTMLNASTNSVPADTYIITNIVAAMGLSPGMGNAALNTPYGAGAIANDVWTNPTGGDLVVTYTIEPVSANGCVGPEFTVTVTIESAPVLNAPAPNVFVCSDAELNTVFSAVAATNSLNITSITVNSVMLEAGLTANPGNITAPDTGMPDFFLADSYRNFTNGGLNATYNITATADNGCTATADYVFRVRGEPVLDPNLDKTICSGEETEVTLALDPLTGFQSATGYDIISITPDAGLTAGMGNASVGNDQSPTAIFNDTWINGTMGPLAVVYAIAPRRANDCVGETVLVTVTVDPGPNVANATATVCSDAPAGVVFGASSNLVPADTYTILSIAPAMGLTPAMGNASTGAGQAADAIENDIFTNLTSGDLDVVYTVTPVSTAGCIGPDFTVTLTIRPEPVVPFQSGDMACSDEPINVTLGNSNPFVSAFNITNIDANMLTASAGNPMTGLGFDDNEIEDDAWTNTTGMPVNVIYTVVPISLDGCPGDFFTVTVQIKPEPVGDDDAVTVCSGKALDYDLVDHVPGTGTFTYTVVSSDDMNVPAGPDRVVASADNITDTYTNTTGSDVTITYTVTPIGTNGCSGESFDIVVTVEWEPVATDDAVMVCSDEALNYDLAAHVPDAAEFTYTVISSDQMNVPAAAPRTMASAANITDTYTNTTNADVTITYTVTPIGANDCEGDEFEVVVTVKPEPVVANVPLDNVCSDQPIGYVLPATDDDGLAITSYDITANVNMDLSGMATEGNGITDVNAIAGDIFTNLNDAGRLVVYTITPYAGDCAGTPFTVTFNIRAEPVLNPGLDKMVCSDELLALTLSNDPTPGLGFPAISGYNLIAILPEMGLAPGMGNLDPMALPLNNQVPGALTAEAWTNTTTATLNVVYQIALLATNGCVGDTVDVTVMIKPEPAISSVTAPAVCSDSPTGFTLPDDPDGPAAATYNITAINPNGLSASAGNPVVVNMVTAAEIANDAWTNATNATVNVVYTIVPVSADGCAGDPFTVTVPIQPEPIVAFQAETVCSDEALGLLLGASLNSTSIAFYQITSITPNGLMPGMGNATVGNGLPNTAIQNDTWTNTGTMPVNVNYVVIPWGSNGCQGNPFGVTITVDPEPVVADQNMTVCSDEALMLTLGNDLDGPNADTYNITNIESNGLTASAGSPATGNGLAANVIADDAWTNTTNDPVDVIYTVVPVSADDCEGDPFTVTVTVKPEPVVANITAGVCSDVAIGVVFPDFDDDGLDITSYDFTAVPAMGLVGMPTTGSGTNLNAIAADVFTNNTSGPLDVVYTVTPYADGCAGTPFTITVTISPEPVFSNVSTINVCSDDALGYILPASSTNMLPLTTFNISAVKDPNLTGTPTTGTGLNDLNAIANDNFNNLTNGGLSVVYTITPFSNGCEGSSFTVTFNIRAEPVLNPNLDVMVCSDEPIGVTLSLDNTIGFQSVTGYNLVSVTPDAGLAGAMGNAAPGNNLPASAIATDVWTNTTSGILSVVYRVAPNRNDFGCLGDEVDITVMIKPEPAISSVTAPAVCSDSPTGFTLPDDPDEPAAASYNITAINTNGLSASAGNPVVANMVTAAEIADDAWTNASGATVNVVYTIVPVSADGCAGDPFTVTVPIQPEPTVLPQIATICSDEPVDLLLGNSALPPSVSLYNITGIGNADNLTPGMGNATTGAGQLSNAIENDTWTNTGMMPADIVYAVVPTGSNGCVGDPFPVTITVNPKPVVNNQTKTVCSGEDLNLLLGMGTNIPADKYNITAIEPNGLTPGMGNAQVADDLDADAIEDDNWTNTTGLPVDVEYTVVPVSADGCEGDPFTVTVTVKPEPVVANLTDGACSDEAIGVQLPAVDDDGLDITSYDIITAVPDMGLVGMPTTGSGTNINAIANDAFTNTTSGPLNVVYTVTPYADGCAGEDFTITVTISPEPVFTNVSTINVCSGDVIGFTLPASSDNMLPLTTFDISAAVHPDLTGTATTGMGLTDLAAIANDAFTNLTNGGLSVVYTVTPFSNGCQGADFTITFNIRPEPVIADKSDMVCSDEPIGFVLPNQDDDGLNLTSADISAMVAPGLVGMASTGTGITDVNFIAADVFTNTTSGPLDVVYTVIPYRLGCAGDPFDITITIKPEPVVADQAQAVCSNVPTGLTLGASTNGTPAVSYNITNIQTNGLIATAGAPMTGTGFAANVIADDAWQNQGLAPVNVVYTVVPVSADGCEGDAFTVTITVSPEPVLDVPMSPIALCSDETLGSVWSGIASTNGQPLSFINLTSVTFSSMSPNFTPNPANAAFPANAVPVDYFENDSYTNLTGGGVFVEYTLVAVTPGGCVSAPFTYEFQIRAEPVLNPNLDKTICSGGNTNLTLSLDPTIGFQTANGFVIDNIAVDAGLVGDPGNVMIGDILTSPFLLDDTWTNDTDGPLTVTYSIRPRRANGCFGDVAEVVVTVEPTPVAALVLTYDSQDETISADSNPLGDEYELTICSGENLAAVGVSTVMPTPGRDLWVKVDLDDPADALGLGTMPTFYAPLSQLTFNQNIVNTTSAPYVISATITPFINFNGNQAIDGGECEGEAFGLIITVNPEPVAVATPSDTELCDDGSFTVDLNTNGSSVTADQYIVTTAVSDPGLTQTSGNAVVGGTVMLSGPMNTIMGTFSNATTSTQTVTYTIVPVSADGCEGEEVVVEIEVWARPATAPAPDSICLGTIANIDPGLTLGSNPVVDYEWTYLGATASNFRINGGSLLNPLSPTGTIYATTTLSINTTSPLASTGLIGFELVVTDDQGCTSEPVEVYIAVMPVPDPGTDGNFGPICEDFGNINLTTLLGGSPDPGGTWEASMSNPAGGTLIGPNFNPAGSVGGIYTFTYTIDNGGCPPVSATVTVNVTPNADAGSFDITADNDVCVGEPSFNLFSLLNANSYDLGGTWSELTSSGAGLDAATGELDLTSALPGNYTFRYLVTVGPTVCPNPTDFEDVILNIIAPPAANPILGNAAPCPNTTANYTLTNALQPGTTRVWSLSGGGMLTFVSDDLLTVEWGNVPGTYTLTLVETRLGCATTNTLQVTISETEANFTFAVGSSDGLTINFTDASVGDPSIWFWDFGDGNTSLDQNPTHVFPSAGDYTVCLDVTGNCGIDQYCEDITITSGTACDDVQLNDGLNLISIDVAPSDSSITSIFASQIANNELVFIQGRNSLGGIVIFDPIFIPFPGLNTLTHFERGKGYYVRMSTPAATTLTVCGEPVDPAYKTDLNATWNIVGYVPQASTTPEAYFAELIPPNSNNLQIARSFENGFKFFDPIFIPFPGLNTLTSIDNGLGYELRVLSAVSGTDWFMDQGEIEDRTDMPFVSDRYMVVAAKSNLSDALVGDFVKVVNESGVILGRMEILPGGLLKTTPLYGHDSFTQEIGIEEGEWLYLQYREEQISLGLQFQADRSIHFKEVTFDVASFDVSEEVSKVALSIAPNPFSNLAQITLDLKADAEIRVVIRDQFGRVMDAPMNLGQLRAGYYSFEWRPNNIPSGVYTLQLFMDDALISNYKLVYQR